MKSRSAYALMPFAVTIAAFTVSRLFESAAVYAVCFAILVFSVPVCLLVAWERLRTGEPPELGLSPLILSRPERELIRNLKTRPRLSDRSFCETFYPDSGFSVQSIAKLRNILAGQIGYNLAGLHPDDDLSLLDDEIDWMIIVSEIEREFGIQFTRTDLEAGPATFDFFARRIQRPGQQQ